MIRIRKTNLSILAFLGGKEENLNSEISQNPDLFKLFKNIQVYLFKKVLQFCYKV